MLNLTHLRHKQGQSLDILNIHSSSRVSIFLEFSAPNIATAAAKVRVCPMSMLTPENSTRRTTPQLYTGCATAWNSP